VRLLRQAESHEKRSITFVAPHAEAGETFVAELYARFGSTILPRLLVERISDCSTVVMRTLIKKSVAANYFMRRNQNAVYCKNFMEMVGRRIGIVNWADHRVLQKYTRLAVSIHQHLDVWVPESLVPQFLVPKSKEWEFALAHVTDEKLFHALQRISRMSEKDQLYHTEPVVRLLEDFLGNPAIEARTSKPQRWDRVAFHNAGGIQVILGEDGYEDALCAVVSADFQETCHLLKTGQIRCPFTYAIDEALNAQLFGWYESRALSTMAGSRLSIDFIIQSDDFPSPEMKRNANQNTDHYWFNCGDWETAMEGARDLLGALDENKVHHTTTKQVHAGFTYEKRHSHGTTEGGENGSRRTVTITEVAVPQYDTVQENVFQTGNEQLIWKAQELQTLPERTCWCRPMGRSPYLMTVPLLEDSWAFPAIPELGIEALSTQKVKECSGLLKTKDIYETPVKPELPATQTPSPSAGTDASKGSPRTTVLQRNKLSKPASSNGKQKPANGSGRSNGKARFNGSHR
jgi:hypothetical protein